MSSHLERLTREVFERHSNPWSAWTRLLSTPLVLGERSGLAGTPGGVIVLAKFGKFLF